MSVNLVVPELFQLEELALHETAKRLTNILVLQQPELITLGLSLMARSSDLKQYKNSVLKAFSTLFPFRFPKLLKDKLFDSMIDIKLGYDAAFDWIAWYHSLTAFSPEDLVHSIISPNTGKYDAIHFIKPLGRFDDVSWTKLFVADENQPLKSRFYLACIYCFEEEIQSLWSTMKLNNQIPSEDDLRRLDENSVSLMKLWISRLEEEIGDDFYVDGWKWTVTGYHDHGASFFWNHCSEDKKAIILSDLDLDEVFNAGVKGRIDFVYFIYRLLSIRLKDDPRAFDDNHNNRVSVFLVFLICSYSYHYKTLLNDILERSNSPPFKLFEYTLEALALKISLCDITLHKAIFKVLWFRLSRVERTNLLNTSGIVECLIHINDFDFLEMIILPLPRSMKERKLLKDFMIQNEEFLSLRRDFEGILPYLLFSLLDYDAESQKLTLTLDAENILDSLINYPANVSDIYIKKFNRVTRCLKNTLPVVDELINGMDSATNVHIFLSEKIYPLFIEK